MFLSKNKASGIFYLWYVVDDRRNKISTQTKDEAEAELFKAHFIKKDVKKKSTPELDEMKLKNYSSVFFNLNKDTYTIGTMKMYISTFKTLLRIIGNKKLVDITLDDIETYKQARLETTKKITVNIDLRNIRSFLNQAVENEIIQKNHLRIRLYAIDETNIKYMSSDDVSRLLSVITNKEHLKIIKFAFLTGMRCKEMVYLQFSDVDINKKTITIRNKENFRVKTGKSRVLPLTDEVIELVEYDKYKNYPDYYIFSYDDKIQHYIPNYITQFFKSYVRKSGISSDFHLHCTRHTFITDKIKKKTPLKAVMMMCGHSCIETTQKYTHLDTEDLRSYMNSSIIS